MKTRQGFVSNSSSSSFVLLLPENFLETIDYDKIIGSYGPPEEDDEEFPLEKLKNLFNDFVKQGGMWDDEIYEYDKGGDWSFYDVLYEAVMPYKIATVEGASGGGQFVVVKRETIKKLL